MSFALIAVDPLSVLKTFSGESLPDPIVWPDGAATHGAIPGTEHGGWMVASLIYSPDSPGEFYQVASASPGLTGSVLRIVRQWTPMDLGGVQTTLLGRLDDAAERRRLIYLTPGAGQALTYQQKFAEAMAYSVGQSPATAAAYPLLAVSIGIEAKADGSGPCATLADVAALVLTVAGQWTAVAAAIEAARLGGKAAVKSASTVDAAVAAYGAVTWP